MQSLNKSDEQQLLDGVKMAVDLVDGQGLSPNEALQKVAQTFHYSPGFLKAACNAFNTGRQLAQWNANDSVLDKLASFPLADYEAIHNKMWGAEQEKAASFSYISPRFMTYDDQVRQELLRMDISSMTKSASAQEVHPLVADEQADNRAKRAYAHFDYYRRLLDEARREKSAAAAKLDASILALEDYFRKFAYDRLPLAQVEHAAAVYYGEPGRALVAHVAEAFPAEKRASAYPKTWSGFHQPADRNKAPYTLIADAIKRAQDFHSAARGLTAAEEKMATAKDGVAPFSQPRYENANGSQLTLTPSLIPDTGVKQADAVSGLSSGLGFGMARGLADYATKGQDKKVQSQIEELDSPEHLNELRKIKAQTVLTQLMSDPENPLSGYDPEEVLSAYNEMVQLSPRLADQPAAIGPLLNKRLVGNTEPFEIGETLKLEEGLKKTQAPPSYTDLMKNEASILS